MKNKIQRKVYLHPDLSERVETATTQFRSAGRTVSRNAVIEQLIEDGLRLWAREAQVVNRVEASIAKLIDQTSQQDQMIKAMLFTLAGGPAEYNEALRQIKEQEAANAE